MASGGSPSDIAVNMEGHPGEGTAIATTTPPPSSAPVPIPSTSTTSTPHQEGDAVAATKEQHLGAATAPKESLAVEKAGKEKGHKRTSSADLKFVAKVLKPSLKKNLSDAPISKELSERARSAPLIKKFNLPATETLLNDYSAALLKHILIHGRMYVSQNYICFESKIFGIKTMEVIPFKDITVLTKKSKKLNFARGIEIATPSQTYYFASFVSRVRAFALLTQIWRQHVPKDDQQPDDDDDDEDDEDAPDYESDDSALKKTKKIVKENSDVNLKLGRSVECPPPDQLKELQEKGLRRFSSPLLSRVVGSSNNKNATVSALATSSTTLLDLPPEPDHSALAASAPVTITSSTASGSTSSIPEPASAPPSAPPSDEEDEGDYDEGDGFLGAEAVYQQVLNTTFNINVKSFFKLFFSDDSTFTQTYRGHRGDKDITVKKWTNSPQFGMIRDVLFMSPVKVPLGPSHTRATETQRYHLSKNRLLIDTVTMFLDIPYGDSFRIEGKWDVSPASPDSCRLIISIGVHFMKKTWFKSKIESQTIKETKESFQQWATVAQAEITKALKSGSHLLHPSTQPPSQPNSQPPSAQSSPLLTTSHATPTAARASPPQSQQPGAPEAEPTGPSPSPHVTTTSASPRNRRRSVAGGSGVVQEKEGRFAILINALTSLTNSSVLEGHNLVTVLMVVVLGVVFLNMYLRIVHLEGKVETLENILQPLLAKQVPGQL